MARKDSRTLVVCGHGMVAQRFLEELVAAGRGAFDRVVVFGAEPAPAYNRIQLSALLAGDTDEANLRLQPDHWFRRHRIDVHPGEPVVRIDRDRRCVVTVTGRVQSFDTLVLATGARAVRPDLPGMALDGVATLRDLADARTLIARAHHDRRAVVVGGGFLGLEAADGLRRRGLDVTVLHRAPHLLNRQLDANGGAVLADHLRSRGLTITTGTAPVRLLGQRSVRAVQLHDDTVLGTDLVVVATGIAPNRSLAEAAGLECGQGIRVNARLQTSDRDIYALGECCQRGDRTFGLVAPGYQQAQRLARHLTGQGVSAPETNDDALATRLKISGVAVFSCGQHSPDAGTESVVWQDREAGHYGHLLIRDQRLVGAVLVGDTRDGDWYQERIRQGDSVADMRAKLPFGKPYCEAAA
ncbi:NAD(P)/FAD-dependent oxidoreductase [Marinobacter sp. C2H3]|uniref:NAD(P)/FAD-dependent oxidoreductase n=1 Tax=Marinobacter sp. C2H3 TaxID=3119003 RepID=UPI00300F73E4